MVALADAVAFSVAFGGVAIMCNYMKINGGFDEGGISVGFWQAQTGLYFNVYNDYSCFTWKKDGDEEPYDSGVSFDGDVAWNFAKVMSIVSIVFGLLSLLLLCPVCCVKTNAPRTPPRTLTFVGGSHVIAGVSALLMLVGLESNTLCGDGADCQLDNGGKISVGIAFLWSLIGIFFLGLAKRRSVLAENGTGQFDQQDDATSEENGDEE